MAIKKETLARLIHDELGYTKLRGAELIDSVLEIIAETLEQGDDVLISGFGKFYVNNKRERRGRNPYTAEQMMLPARRVVGFRCTGKLRETISGDDILS